MFILSPFYTPKYREGSERFFGRAEGWGKSFTCGGGRAAI